MSVASDLHVPARMPPLALAWVALVLAALVVLAFLSDGVIEDDDVTHYLMARWSWTYPMYLADDWGRPGFTVPYALVAWLGTPAQGLFACRLLTIVIVAASTWLTWKTATIVLENRYSWLAPVALLAMPLYLRLGYTTLTETTAGLYTIAGTWLLASDRPRRAALVLSLVPLTRHEGILLLPAAAILLAWRGSWSSLPLLLFGEIAWNLAKPALGYPLSELPILRFAGRGDPGHLGYGGPLHYLGAGAQAFGIVPLMLGVVGAIALLRRWWRDDRFRYRPALAGLLLCAGGLLSLIAIQTVLFMINTHESGGYARFLLPAAPWAAVCVAAAISTFADADHATRRQLALVAMVVAGGASLGIWFDGWSPWPFAMSGLIVAALIMVRPSWTPRLAAALAGLAAVQMAIAFRPHRLLDHQRTVVDVVETLRREHPDAHVVGDNPWTDFAADVARHPYFWAPNDWRRPPSLPLIYVWDADHSMVNLPLDDLTALPHRELATDDAYVRVFDRH